MRFIKKAGRVAANMLFFVSLVALAILLATPGELAIRVTLMTFWPLLAVEVALVARWALRHKLQFNRWPRFTRHHFTAFSVHFGVLMVVSFFVMVGGGGSPNCEKEYKGVTRELHLCMVEKTDDEWQTFLHTSSDVPRMELETLVGDPWPSPDGSALYVTFGDVSGVHWPSAVVKVPRGSAKIERAYPMKAPNSVRCLDDGICVVSSAAEQAVLVIDDEANEVLAVHHMPGCNPGYMDISSQGEVVVQVTQAQDVRCGPEEPTPCLLTGDVDWQVQLHELEVCQLPAGNGEALLHVSRNEVRFTEVEKHPESDRQPVEQYFSVFDEARDRIIRGKVPQVVSSVSTTPQHSEVEMPFEFWLRGKNFATDAVMIGDHLFVSYPFGGLTKGMVLVYDEDMEVVRRISMPQGVRPMTYDPSRHLLFVGIYASGEVYAINPDTGEVVGQWSVGQVLRRMHYVPARDEILTASAEGIHSLRLSQIVGTHIAAR